MALALTQGVIEGNARGCITDLAVNALIGAAIPVAGRMLGKLAAPGAKAIAGAARAGAVLATGAAKVAAKVAAGGLTAAVKVLGRIWKAIDCFPAGTKVVVGTNEDGSYQTRSIESLQIGDLVLARDQNDPNAPLVYKPVVQTFAHTTYALVNLEVADAAGNIESIRATVEHPFYVEGYGWKQADVLAAGDRVQKPDGAWATVQSVTSELHPEGVTVYNLEVADAHTYFVEDGQGAQSAVWVHNAICLKQIVLGAYDYVKGHHIFAKAAFLGSRKYKLGQALSLAKDSIRSSGFDHDLATASQRFAYAALAAAGKTLTMKREIQIAKNALIAGGMTAQAAKAIVKQALSNLRSMGVKAPTRIPWT